jgi:ribosomal protein S18 acetylase RimI-like enzyme
MSELLDNAVWHALLGPHATLAERLGQSARYPSSVGVFSGLPDDATAASPAWDDLATLVGPGAVAVLFRAEIDAPPRWEVEGRVPGLQMVWDDAAAAPVGAPDAIELGPDDVDDMLELVARTKPGPFARETIDLGTYLGVREDGRLIAMAGERMRLAGATEVSAVCTDVEHRGRGLAAALVGELVRAMLRRGDRPFLHATSTNERAISVYEQLGFRTRRHVDAAILRAPGPRLSAVASG